MKRTLKNAISFYRNWIILIVCVIAALASGVSTWRSSGQTGRPTAGNVLWSHTRFLASDRLFSISSDDPDTPLTNVALGIGGTEDMIAIDFRPANRQLYGVVTNGTASRLVTINTSTGAVSTVGTGFTPPIPMSVFCGFDFNPVADYGRVVCSNDLNIRVNPNTGATMGVDTNVSFPTGMNPFIDEIAYSNNFPGATQTTLYGGEAVTASLVTIGGANGNPSPNGGGVFTVGPFLFGPANTSFGMDIASDGTAYAGYNNTLFSINLATGQVTSLGTMPTTKMAAGLAVELTDPFPTFDFPLVTVGPGMGDQLPLAGFDPNGDPQGLFNPFGNTYRGGTTVAVGDVNGDGRPEVAAGTETGNSRVVVYDGFNRVVHRDFNAYPGFNGGVRVALGDVNADGIDDIITGAGPGAMGHVKVFNGVNNALVREFFAFGTSFTGGVFVGSADVNGDRCDDVIVGAGPGGGPQVKVFSGANGSELRSFFAYDATFLGGVYVAAGDVNGDGLADIITGAGAGAGPHVRVFSGATGNQLLSFFAYPVTFMGGVRVAAADVDNNGVVDIVSGAGPGAGPHVKVFNGGSGAELASFFAFANRPEESDGIQPQAGIFVAGAGRPTVAISGRVTTPAGLNLRNAVVVLTNAQGLRRTATTSSFGLYAFANVTTGQTYAMSVGSKRYRFAPRTLTVNGNLANVDFIGLE